MLLSANEIAKMIDLSCVRTTSSKADIDEMVAAAKKYGFRQVTVLQCFLPYTKSLLAEAPQVRLIGNVSFPSGSDSTTVKVFQAKEMAAAGCDEIDMVINVGRLRSGELPEVEQDVRAVVETARPLPVKVIIEIMYLNRAQVEQACEICIRSGAAFVKTGSGWANRGTTLEDVRLIKAIVGERIQIKAAGGIRSLADLEAMYQAGARRFGINLKSGIEILESCKARNESQRNESQSSQRHGEH
jgi:deoxyribose-phosphate aldolase